MLTIKTLKLVRQSNGAWQALPWYTILAQHCDSNIVLLLYHAKFVNCTEDITMWREDIVFAIIFKPTCNILFII